MILIQQGGGYPGDGNVPFADKNGEKEEISYEKIVRGGSY